MKQSLWMLAIVAALVATCNCTPLKTEGVKADEMWIANIGHGISAFHENPNDYKVYRNVRDFGCVGDGVTDDTDCINNAISFGDRCGDNCGSSTLTPALVYFPSGRYLIKAPIIMYYFTQMVGNVNDPPVLVASEDFQGSVLDSNPYKEWGATWYTVQNNFFRQVRNFVIDLTLIPFDREVNGIHWQVAQATSLVNIRFVMSTEPGTNHIGVNMEDGSGGFMSDLTFDGGKYGMRIGNQQFLTKNLVFNRCQTAILMHWNWQWSFKSLKINNCNIGVEMTNPHEDFTSHIGSALILDSVFTDTQTAVLTLAPADLVKVDTSGTLLFDNVKLVNVGVGAADVSGAILVPGGTTTIQSWGRGSMYVDQSGTGSFHQDNLPIPQKSPNLLDAEGNFFERSRPQYGDKTVNDFASVRDFGAVGDGQNDDSDAIQNAIDQSKDSKIVFFPAGSYIISKTIFVPGGTRITGETWSILMASGSAFQSQENPQPVFRVGEPGEVGDVEITDVMFSVKGPQPGAILVQWNIRGTSQGSAGMWDAHFRVGGTQGSDLQFTQCPKFQSYNPNCFGAFMLLHLTSTSSAYLENVWAWTADHDLDNHLEQGQVTIYTGRGVLIESVEGPVFLYGTQSEHNVLYQYQVSNAKNVFMTMIQSETPYWQPGPKAPEPFQVSETFNDPSFDHCDPASTTCALAWSLRSVQSSNIYIYGTGLYNFFNNYDTDCFDLNSCQDAHVTLEDNHQLYIYNMNTRASVNMVVDHNTQVLAKQVDNSNFFCQSINAFLTQAN